MKMTQIELTTAIPLVNTKMACNMWFAHLVSLRPTGACARPSGAHTLTERPTLLTPFPLSPGPIVR